MIKLLNAILHLPSPIVSLTLLNPYTEKEFEDSKQTIVDIKAVDGKGNIYQIEVQIQSHAALPERMVYTWSSIFQTQLKEGQSFSTLKPLISIWFLQGKLKHTAPSYHHHFQLWDTEHKACLTQHCSIHVLELAKWELKEHLSEEEQWLYFLKEASNWTVLPSVLQNPDLLEAMSIMRTITEKELEWDRYMARKTYLHVMATMTEEQEKIARERDQMVVERDQMAAERDQMAAEAQKKKEEKERAEADKERAEADKERAEADKERAEAALEKETARAREAEARREQEVKQAEIRAERLAARLRQLGFEE